LHAVTPPQLRTDLPSTPLNCGASIFVMTAFTHPRLNHSAHCNSGSAVYKLDANSRMQGKSARQTEKGAGHLKAIVITLILISLVYVGFKVVPYLISEYAFQDGIQDIARYASAMRQDAGKVRMAVLKEAEKDDIPVTSEDIKIEGTGGNFRISADYSVIVDLKVYQWTLNFHPAVSNNALF